MTDFSHTHSQVPTFIFNIYSTICYPFFAAYYYLRSICKCQIILQRKITNANVSSWQFFQCWTFFFHSFISLSSRTLFHKKSLCPINLMSLASKETTYFWINRLTLVLMKSHAKSFNDLSVNVLAGTVTMSRKLPNWKRNAISGPAIVCDVGMLKIVVIGIVITQSLWVLTKFSSCKFLKFCKKKRKRS